TGIVSVPAQTPAGTYTIEYQICELLNPANCDTAIVTVVAEAAVILANDDDFSGTPVSGGNDTPNILINDTLNGNGPVVIGTNPGEVTLTGITVPPGLTLNPDGTITVGITTPSGTYTIEYQICEVLNPTNCDQAIVTIVVSNEIIANNDAPQVVEINVAGPVFAGSVITNDTLNGVAVTTTNTDVTPTTQGPLSIDVDGNVTI
ncbi:hypothetical protein ACFSX9_03945, partial [Flavobacterium ardleyense]